MKILNLYGTIGEYPLTAEAIAEQIKGYESEGIEVHFLSPGGDIMLNGPAIYNLFKRFKGPKRAAVDGLAASAASYILLAFDDVSMSENSQQMIHKNKATFDHAGQEEIKDYLRWMDNTWDFIRTAYAAKMGMAVEKFEEWVGDGERWLSAQQCMDLHLCTAITDRVDIAAKFDLSKFKSVPKGILDMFGLPSKSKSKAQGGKHSMEKLLAFLNSLLGTSFKAEEEDALVASLKAKIETPTPPVEAVPAAMLEKLGLPKGTDVAKVMGTFEARLDQAPASFQARLVAAEQKAAAAERQTLIATGMADELINAAKAKEFDAKGQDTAFIQAYLEEAKKLKASGFSPVPPTEPLGAGGGSPAPVAGAMEAGKRAEALARVKANPHQSQYYDGLNANDQELFLRTVVEGVILTPASEPPK